MSQRIGVKIMRIPLGDHGKRLVCKEGDILCSFPKPGFSLVVLLISQEHLGSCKANLELRIEI